MKAKAYHLKNGNIRDKCLDYVRALNLGEDYVVTIKKAKESRSGAQNRLRWLWFTVLEKELAGVGMGRNKEEWNLFFKGKYARSILIAQDESYSDFYRSADALIAASPNPRFAKEVLLENVRTEWMTLRSMQCFLELVERYCLIDLSITLPTPDDLLWVRGNSYEHINENNNVYKIK